MRNVTVFDAPAPSVTRSNPRSRFTGWTMVATGSWRYSWTTSSPARSPVFVTSTLTSIRPPRAGHVRAEPQVVELERRVRQAEAERQLRAGRQVEVLRRVLVVRVGRTAGVLVVVVDRHLADRARERDRQLAARVHLAEQHVRDRVARPARPAPTPRGPRARRRARRDRQRPAVDQHDDERLAGRLDRGHELLLHAGQADVAARGRLAAHGGGLADRDDGDVGARGRRAARRRTRRCRRR